MDIIFLSVDNLALNGLKSEKIVAKNALNVAYGKAILGVEKKPFLGHVKSKQCALNCFIISHAEKWNWPKFDSSYSLKRHGIFN